MLSVLSLKPALRPPDPPDIPGPDSWIPSAQNDSSKSEQVKQCVGLEILSALAALEANNVWIKKYCLHWLYLEPTHLRIHCIHWLHLEPTHLRIHCIHWLHLEPPTHLTTLLHLEPLTYLAHE
jgi:hypothetical protein